MKYGLIGAKLSHSFSPEIHKKIGDYGYFLKELFEDELEDFFKKRDFLGVNVTVPYKKAVMPFLDEISEQAGEIGCVNTVVNKDGRLIGFNTDASGLEFSCKKNKIDFIGKNVVILGSGGTSLTAFYVSKKCGAKSIIRVSRSKREGFITYNEIPKSTDIIINTTPCGMYPDMEKLPVDIGKFKNLYSYIDVIYNPLNTPAMQQAKSIGAITAGGLDMLINQAVLSAELFGIKNIADTETVYNEILREKRNIVLIGMPSCGKTTVGKLLAKELGKDFVDTDELISRKTGNTEQFIIENGEAAFRKEEAAVIKSLALKNGLVIATGGGAVLAEENRVALKLNGLFVYLKRDINKLEAKGRPLSKDLNGLYESRREIYENAADIIIDNNGDIFDTVKKAAEEI